MACADVTSANVVGYVNKDLNASGNSPIGASFCSIGSTGIKLSEIKVGGYAAGATINGVVNIQVLASNGTVDQKYLYYQNVKSGPNKGKEGWYLDGTTAITPENDVVFPAGQGLWVKGNATAKLVSSGEVIFDPVVVNLTSSGNVMICNPFAQEIKLSKNVKVTGILETATVNGTINIQLLNSNGTVDKKYLYYQNVKSGPNKGKEGWYDNGTTAVTADNDVTLSIGEALWVKGIANAQIKFVLDEE